MYYDATGRPDPNGDYEFRNGAMILRSGRMVHFNIHMMDSAGPPPVGARYDAMMNAARTSPPTLIADAEQQQAEINDAYSEMVDHLTSRWKQPADVKTADSMLADEDAGIEDAYAAMCRDLETAWQRKA